MLKAPYLALHWSLDVGRDCPAAIAEGDASRAQSSKLAGSRSIPPQPEAVTAVESRTEGVDGAATEATARRLRSLIGEVAHEIRTPLAVAGQLLDTFLCNPRANAGVASHDLLDLRAARARLTQASNWAQDILDERHLGSGNLPCVRRRFYPGQWKNSIEPLIESLAAMHQLQVRWVGWDRSLPRLYLDADHLSRAVLNLLSNAFKASPPGSIVSIRVAWQTVVTQRLVIAIEDRGPGLTTDRLRQMVSDKPNRSDSGSTGIGLRITRALLSSMNGSVSAETCRTGGTLFRLTLPVDSYPSLVRSWLLSNSQPAAYEPTSLCDLTIHTLRVDGGQSEHVDIELQTSAQPSDLIYRTARTRWLWLSMRPRSRQSQAPLQQALQRLQDQTMSGHAKAVTRVLSSCVYRKSDLDMRSLITPATGRASLMQLTSSIAGEMARLVGRHVPPVDEVADRRREIDRLIIAERLRYQQQADSPNRGSREPTRVRRDRGSAEMLSGAHLLKPALHELATQWRKDQQKIDAAKFPSAHRTTPQPRSGVSTG